MYTVQVSTTILFITRAFHMLVACSFELISVT